MRDDLQSRAETVSEFPEILAMRAAHVSEETINAIRARHPRGTELYDRAVGDALLAKSTAYTLNLKTHNARD